MSIFNFFGNDASNERRLLESVIREHNKGYGPDCYYMKRTNIDVNKIFGEDNEAMFESAFKLPLILENPESWGGGQQLFNKFGMNFTFTQSLSIGMEHFRDETSLDQPIEGDLIYIPMMNKFFEVGYVNPYTTYYETGQLFVFKMDVHEFMFNGEGINTGVDDVDDNKPIYDSSFIEDDNDVIDDEELKNEIINDWDEVDDINLNDE